MGARAAVARPASAIGGRCLEAGSIRTQTRRPSPELRPAYLPPYSVVRPTTDEEASPLVRGAGLPADALPEGARRRPHRDSDHCVNAVRTGHPPAFRAPRSLARHQPRLAGKSLALVKQYVASPLDQCAAWGRYFAARRCDRAADHAHRHRHYPFRRRPLAIYDEPRDGEALRTTGPRFRRSRT